MLDEIHPYIGFSLVSKIQGSDRITEINQEASFSVLCCVSTSASVQVAQNFIFLERKKESSMVMQSITSAKSRPVRREKQCTEKEFETSSASSPSPRLNASSSRALSKKSTNIVAHEKENQTILKKSSERNHDDFRCSSQRSSPLSTRSVLGSISNDSPPSSGEEEEEELARIYNDTRQRTELEYRDSIDCDGRHCLPSRPFTLKSANVIKNTPALSTGSRSAFQIIQSKE